MDFILTEEQKQIKALIKQFCKRELDVKQARELNDRAFLLTSIEELRAYKPVDLMEKMHEVGLRQLTVPAKYGGGDAGRSFVTRAVAAEQAGYSGEDAGMLLVWPWFGNAIMANSLTEAQQDWYFSQFMDNHAMTMGGTISEEAGATDMHLPYDESSTVLKTFAYKEGDEWVINGSKMFGSGVGIADLIQVTCRTAKEGPVSRSMTSFWVPKDAPGLTLIPNRLADIGSNVQSYYDNVRVPESHLMGEVNRGFDILNRVIADKLTLWTMFIGTAQRLYEGLRDYAREKVQGGKPIIQHSSIAVMLGNAAIDIEATRALAYRAAWENEQAEKAGAPLNLFWSLAVLHQVKSMMVRVSQIAADVYGGIGMTFDMPLQSFIRNAFMWSVSGSTRSANALKCSREYDTKYSALLVD